MPATRLIAKAAASKSAPIAATIAAKAPKGFKPAKAAKPVDTVALVTKLQDATYAAICGMNEARGKVASMVLVIRECMQAKMDKDTMGAHMQIGCIMRKCKVDATEAAKLLSAEKRSPDVATVLHDLKRTKSRAMAVIKSEDEPKISWPKGSKGAGKRTTAPTGKAAKLFDDIKVVPAVNVAELLSQVAKARAILAKIVDGAKGLDGAADILKVSTDCVERLKLS